MNFPKSNLALSLLEEFFKSDLRHQVSCEELTTWFFACARGYCSNDNVARDALYALLSKQHKNKELLK